MIHMGFASSALCSIEVGQHYFDSNLLASKGSMCSKLGFELTSMEIALFFLVAPKRPIDAWPLIFFPCKFCMLLRFFVICHFSYNVG